MGKDEHKTGSRGGGALSQTPKNLKIPANAVNEEYARELAELTSLRQKRLNQGQPSKKN